MYKKMSTWFDYVCYSLNWQYISCCSSTYFLLSYQRVTSGEWGEGHDVALRRSPDLKARIFVGWTLETSTLAGTRFLVIQLRSFKFLIVGRLCCRMSDSSNPVRIHASTHPIWNAHWLPLLSLNWCKLSILIEKHSSEYFGISFQHECQFLIHNYLFSLPGA